LSANQTHPETKPTSFVMLMHLLSIITHLFNTVTYTIPFFKPT